MKRKTCRGWPILALILSLVSTGRSQAAVKITDLKSTSQPQGGSHLVLTLDQVVPYDLEFSQDRLALVFHHAEKTERVTQQAAALASFLTLGPGTAPADLKFSLKLQEPLQGVKVSWSSDGKVFDLEMMNEKNDTLGPQKEGLCNLNKIRFVVEEKHTRMALDLDRKPYWELVCSGDKHIRLTLAGQKKAGVSERYGPFKRLQAVTLKNIERKIDLQLQLENALPHLALFWNKAGQRLVLDLNDQTPVALAGSLSAVPASPSSKGLIVLQPVQIKGKEQLPQVTGPAVLENKPVIRKESVVTGDAVARQSAVTSVPTAEPQPSGKAAGPTTAGPAPEQKPAEQKPIDPAPKPLTTYAASKVEPQVETTLPDIFNNKEVIKTLSGQEAFLFGRIQEAWEIKDFEKGAALIHDFIANFPQSPLNKHLSFLEGDFVLALFKSGRKEMLPQLVRTYQDAVSKFTQADEVPYAMLKIAQAYAFNGEYYNALGNINLLLTHSNHGQHMPAAYITRGKVLLQLKQPEKAIADFKYILEHFPTSTSANEARYGIAEYFHSEAVYDEADKRMQEIEKSDPHFYFRYPEYLFLRAKNYFYLKEYDLAREYYFRSLNLGQQPEARDLLLAHLGDTYFQEERNGEAEKFYRLIVDYYPQSEGAMVAKIRLSNNASGVSGFQEVAGDGVSKPIHDLAILKMAQKQFKEGQYEAALTALQKLITQFTATPDIKKEATALYHAALEAQIKKLDEARQYAALTRFYDSRQGELETQISSEAELMAAHAFFETGQYHDTIEILSKIKPTALAAEVKGRYIVLLAESYFREGESQKAESILQKGLKERLPPADKQRMTLVLATVYQKEGELKKAYELADAVVKDERLLRDQEIAGAYLTVGQIAMQDRKYEKSREALNRCIALSEKDKASHPLLLSALIGIANGYHDEGRHAQAVKYYQDGFRQGFDAQAEGYMEARFRQAVSLSELGENKEAEQILSEIAEEGDFALQQRAQLKLGTIELSKQLKQLHLKNAAGGDTI